MPIMACSILYLVYGIIMLTVAGPVDAPKICYKCKKAGHLSRDCKEQQPDDQLQSHAISEAEENPNMSALNTSQEDRVAMEEDDIHEIGEEEKEKLNDVDYLTGNPLPNDILLYAVPVCGPYNAVQSYKYRVKIIPGTVKKGKGCFLFYYLILHHQFTMFLLKAYYLISRCCHNIIFFSHLMVQLQKLQ